MKRVATFCSILFASGTALAEPTAPPQAIEIPGDGDIPLENRLTSVEVDRDLLFATGFDRRTARAQTKAGRLAEAEAVYRLIVSEETTAADSDERFLAWAEGNLGGLLAQRGQDEEAERILRRALARVEWRPDSEREIYQIGCNLGGLLASHGRFAEAEPVLRRTVREMDRRNFKGTVYALHSQLALAYTLFAQDKAGELAPLLASIRTQIARFNYGGTEYETGLHRLQCLAAGTCRVGQAELRAEIGRAMTPASTGKS